MQLRSVNRWNWWRLLWNNRNSKCIPVPNQMWLGYLKHISLGTIVNDSSRRSFLHLRVHRWPVSVQSPFLLNRWQKFNLKWESAMQESAGEICSFLSPPGLQQPQRVRCGCPWNGKVWWLQAVGPCKGKLRARTSLEEQDHLQNCRSRNGGKNGQQCS